jgi:hypothetical protein
MIPWPQLLANETGCTVRATGGYSSGNPVLLGGGKISRWMYKEDPGIWGRIKDYFAGGPTEDRIFTFRDDVDTYASEDGKWYEFHSDSSATGAPSPCQPPGSKKECCGAK